MTGTFCSIGLLNHLSNNFLQYHGTMGGVIEVQYFEIFLRIIYKGSLSVDELTFRVAINHNSYLMKVVRRICFYIFGSKDRNK